jgi:hypothetical protein
MTAAAMQATMKTRIGKYPRTYIVIVIDIK